MSYPVMLSLKGKKCLVAGAGRVAARKTRRLLAEGAHVSVVAPEHALYFSANKKIRLIRRKFRAADLGGKFLVIAATGDAAANADICRLAQKRNMLANNSSSRRYANFMNMAEFRGRGVVIAVSSRGRDVKASVALRDRLRIEAGAGRCGN